MQLVCPKCESPHIKEKPQKSRECLDCGFFNSREGLESCGSKTISRELEDWFSWECVEIPHSNPKALQVFATTARRFEDVIGGQS